MKRYLFILFFMSTISFYLISCNDKVEIQESDWSRSYPFAKELMIDEEKEGNFFIYAINYDGVLCFGIDDIYSSTLEPEIVEIWDQNGNVIIPVDESKIIFKELIYPRVSEKDLKMVSVDEFLKKMQNLIK